MMGHIMVARKTDTFWSLECGRIDIARILTEGSGDHEIHQRESAGRGWYVYTRVHRERHGVGR
jgi:hypothetical protein